VGAGILGVFGRPLRHWATLEFGTLIPVHGIWLVFFPAVAMVVAMLALTLIYWVARPKEESLRHVLPRSHPGYLVMVAGQRDLRVLRPPRALQRGVRRSRGRNWLAGLDANLRGSGFPGRRLERRSGRNTNLTFGVRRLAAAFPGSPPFPIQHRGRLTQATACRSIHSANSHLR
jgi:hypothetical protein